MKKLYLVKCVASTHCLGGFSNKELAEQFIKQLCENASQAGYGQDWSQNDYRIEEVPDNPSAKDPKQAYLDVGWKL